MNINELFTDAELGRIYKALDFYGDYLQGVEKTLAETAGYGSHAVDTAIAQTTNIRRLANQIDEVRTAAKRGN